MVQLSSFVTSDALDDVRSSMATKYRRLDEFEKLVEGGVNVEPDYKLCLQFLLRNIENHPDLCRIERVNAEYNYEDGDEEMECQRKTGNEIERIYKHSFEVLALRNEKAPMDKQVFDMQALSSNRSNKRCSGKYKTVVKKDSAREREKEVSNEKNRKFLEVSLGKNVVKRKHDANVKAAIKMEREQLYGKPDPRNSLVTKYHFKSCADKPVRSNREKEIQRQTELLKDIKEKNLVVEDRVANRMAVIKIDDDHLYKKRGPENNQAEYQYEDLDQYQSCVMVQIQRNLREVAEGNDKVKVENEARKNLEVGEEIELLYHKPCAGNNQEKHNRWERVDWSKPNHKDEEQSIKNENELQGDEILNQNNAPVNVKAPNYPRVCWRNNDGNTREKEAAYECDHDVEIINSAVDFNAGNLVMSKKLHGSMGAQDDILSGSSSAQHDFRRQVLNVLNKPYDKQEYKMLREAVRVGLYFNYHPDLAKKIVKHRHKRGKCLAILRGFFFWLQNLTREGSFKPWKDGECLAVDPYRNIQP